MFTCACQEYRTVEYDERIHSLEEIRQRCCVIHNLLIPDDIWEEYKNFETATRDAAVHSPTIFLSLLRGNLQKITSPIHKYLFDGDKPKSALTTQYKKDLQERWMFEEDIISCHHKEKSFQGRIAEMQTVEWLENHAWRINNLEALGGNSDIEAIRPIDQKSSIEVKYIGERDEELEQSIRALSGLPAGGRSPTHVGCNYLLFRVYEAAFKLKQAKDKRIAFIVIENLAWTFFDFPLRYSWINWRNPSFYEIGDNWKNFLDGQRKRYPSIENDLPSTINTLNELWILERGNGYALSVQFHCLF